MLSILKSTPSMIVAKQKNKKMFHKSLKTKDFNI